MDFAKNLLEKYGWSEGKGLGRNENGIVEPLKPQLKFDRSGIDHDIAEQFTNNWWERLYNKASSNINIDKDDGTVTINLNGNSSVDITTKEYSTKKENLNYTYNAFIKKATLTASGVEPVVKNNSDTESDNEIEKSKMKSKRTSGILELTDAEILAACGGRTAHKGARYGLNLKGKLDRIELQEKEFQEKLNQKQPLRCILDISKNISKDKKKSKKKARATAIFLADLKVTSIEEKPKSKKKCEQCNHKKCTCDVTVDDLNTEVFVKKSKKKSSIKLVQSCDDIITLKKNRKLGTSDDLEESNTQKAGKIKKRKNKRVNNKIKKVAKSLDSLTLGD